MKISILLLMIGTIQMMASPGYSQRAELSLEMENVAVKDVLEEIESNSEFFFLYSSKMVDLDRKVSIQASEDKIEQILANLFRGENINPYIIDRQIILSPDNLEKEEVTAKIKQQQQQHEVSGTVTDAQTGEPLPGVNIVVQGTTTGTTTNMDGEYSIEAPEDATLVFSFVGYQEVTVDIEGQQQINVEMEQAVTELEEVVAIGYGTAKRRDLTGAVSSVTSEDIERQPIKNVQEGLQGKVAGLNIRQTSGNLSGDFSVYLRGMGSTSNNNQPLWVIDGVPLSGATNRSGNVDMSFLNPESIEAIEVLKGPSATAIYGSRASNGVIMVTTKTGSEGETRIDFSADYGIENPIIPDMYEMANTEENLYAKRQRYLNAGITVPDVIDTDSDIQEQVASHPSHDWPDKMFDQGSFQKYNLSASGGSENIQYGINGTFNDKSGTFILDDYQKYSLLANVDAHITDNLTVGVRAQGTYENYDRGYRNWEIWSSSFWHERLNQAWMSTPWIPYRNDEDELAALPNDDPLNNVVANTRNFLGYIEHGEKYISDNHNFLGNFYVRYNFLENFTYEGRGGYEYRYARNYEFYPIRTWSVFKQSVNEVENNDSKNRNWVTHHTLTYQNDLGAHSIKAMIGTEAQKFHYTSWNMSTRGAKDPAFTMHGSQPEISGFGEWQGVNGLLSYFARVNYDYQDKYYITATFRRDGSSKFGTENKWGNFPSGSVAWRVSEESFLQRSEAISNLKLRLEYGLTGNQQIPSYQYIMIANTGVVPANNSTVGSATPGSPINPAIQWESQKQFNAGLDYGFLNNRISGNIDLYQKKSEDLLSTVQLPVESGFGGGIVRNIGSMVNKGIEFQLNSVNITGGDFTWETNFNIAYNENEVIEVGTTPTGEKLELYGGNRFFTGNSTITKAGNPISMIWGYEWEGTIDDPEVAEQYDTEVGSYKFKDRNGDGTLNNEDKILIDQGFPKLTGGLQNTFSYKNLDFSVYMYWGAGYSLFNSMASIMSAGSVGLNFMKEWANNYYTEDNPSDKWVTPRNTQWRYNHQTSTRWTEKADYLRIQNVSLTYHLPQKWVQKAGVPSASLSLIGSNLYTFTNSSAMDPEANYFRNNPLSQGITSSQYPMSRSFHIKLSLGL